MRSIEAALAVCFVAVTVSAAAQSPAPLPPVPKAKQLAWQRMEMTMFVHFGVNTFTDREWGDGKEDPGVFLPGQLDASQWVKAAKDAGFKLVILTAKHHDGFCLWPSAHTSHSVKGSPWREGQGDVVREFVAACRHEGLKVGLYLSPWDRHEKTYGTDAYNSYFHAQLSELLSEYGPIDEVWFDGACGEGPNGKRQVYAWADYYETVYRHAPGAVIAIMGPDIRWVGNEDGLAKLGETSVQDPVEGIHPPDAEKVWYPAECDVSIRPGWFYHASEDSKVKSLQHLVDIYFKSVGRNSVLLVNVPPDRQGLFADPDVARLKEFGRIVREINGRNLALRGKARASASRGEAYSADMAVDSDLDTYWAPPDGVIGSWLEADLGKETPVNVLNVQEAIVLGERVKEYRLELRSDGVWRNVAEGTVIGHRNLHRLKPAVKADGIRLVIEKAKAPACIAALGAGFSPGLEKLDD